MHSDEISTVGLGLLYNYTLYCICVIMGRRTRAAAAEADAVGEQFSLTTRDYNAHQRH